MSTTEQRFEVPPEYAEVYERAYRRAYEEGQNQLNGGAQPETAPRRLTGRGKRVAVPEQRTGNRRERTEVRPGGSHSAHDVRVRERTARRERKEAEAAAAVEIADPPQRIRQRTGHRGARRRGSTLLPILALMTALAVLLVGAFLLGRVTADAVSVDDNASTGTGPGAVASATEGAKAGSATTTGAVSVTTPYDGPQGPLAIASAQSTCTQTPSLPDAAADASYDVTNVLDDDPNTAWGCAGASVGSELTFDLPAGAQVVSIGLVPGYATTDPATGVDRYAQDNRITEVAWVFSDGSQVVQSISDDPLNRSLRAVQLAAKESRSVTMKILGVTQGEVDATMISTVVIEGPTG